MKNSLFIKRGNWGRDLQITVRADYRIFVQEILAQIRSHRTAIRQVRLPELAPVLIWRGTCQIGKSGVFACKLFHITQVMPGVASVIGKPFREVFG